MFDFPIYLSILFILCIVGGIVCVPLLFIVVGTLALRERTNHQRGSNTSSAMQANIESFVVIVIGVVGLVCAIFGLWSMWSTPR
jgi:hypothetical protein